MWISFLSTQKCKHIIETAKIWKQISSALIFSTAPQLTNNSSISVKWFIVLRYPLNTLHIITKRNSVRHSRSIFVTTTEIQRFTGYQKLITKTLFVTWNNLKFNQTWKKNAEPNEQPSNVYSCLRWPTIGYCITNAKFFREFSKQKIVLYKMNHVWANFIFHKLFKILMNISGQNTKMKTTSFK